MFHATSLIVRVCAAALAFAPASAEYAFGQASFRGLGDLPGGAFSSMAWDVSGNGQVVVGQSAGAAGTEACRWLRQPDGTWTLLSVGDLSGGSVFATARGASFDGSIIAGFGISTNGPEAFRWTFAGGFEPLGDIPGGPDQSNAFGMSSDGVTVVGNAIGFTSSFEPVMWPAGAGSAQILQGAVGGHAHAVSANGSDVVGSGQILNKKTGLISTHAVRWAGGGMSIIAMDDTPGAPPDCSALGMSDDGAFVVGSANGDAFVAGAGGTTNIAPGAFAYDVAEGGSRVVGFYGTPTAPQRAFIWEPGSGFHDLKDFLTNEYGLDLTGWTLNISFGISNDGTVIVGFGVNPSGQQEAWAASIPVDTDGDGLLDDWEDNGIPYTDSFGAEQRYVLDVDGDGLADCDPLHKDLFIEVDAMTGLAPANAALSRVVSAFAAAPVSNPDGVNGVKLHCVLDDTNIPAAAWTLDNIDADPDLDWPTEFDALKLTASSGTTLAGHFGTTVERDDPDGAGIREAKAKAYRYCIFAQNFDAIGTSGLSELPGNDFIVSLGLWTPAGGTTDQQAGTFMHELGHALGLGHGGRAPDGTRDSTNFKPNYYSVMSYNWQTPKAWMTPGSWPLAGTRVGYSSFAIPTINEASADDCLPALVVPGSSLAGVRYPHNTHNDGAAAPVVVYGRFDVASDWNNDDTQQCGGAALPVDLTRVRSNHGRSPNEVLRGRDDWGVIVYKFTDLPEFNPGVHGDALGDTGGELDFAEHLALSALLPPFCTGDVDDDREVAINDLLEVINAWGACPNGCPADIAPATADGQVNINDLLAVINSWGLCP